MLMIYIQQHYEQPYDQSNQFLPEAGPSNGGPPSAPVDVPDKARGRKRTRTQVGSVDLFYLSSLFTSVLLACTGCTGFCPGSKPTSTTCSFSHTTRSSH